MDASLILDNLLTPPILFFVLGLAAPMVKSDLSIPQPAARFLSLYLLFAIGFHGGVELRGSGFGGDVLLTLGLAIAASALVPLWSFAMLRLWVSTADAAAIAASYGSISAVTFITAASFLENLQIPYSGHMVAAMALMESPAIIVGVLLFRRFGDASASGVRADGQPQPPRPRMAWRELLREAFLNGAVFLLLGSLVIGLITGQDGWESVKPLVKDPFTGALCLFLLDMGIIAGQRLGDLRRSGAPLIAFGLISPLVHGALGIALSRLIGLGDGDALLLTVLLASASYIAVPAAMRLAVPQANPSLYLPLALTVTFPLNITLGLPVFLGVIQAISGGG